MNIIKLATYCKSTLLAEVTLIGITALTLLTMGALLFFMASPFVVILSMFAVGYMNSQFISNAVNTRACKEGD